MPTNHSQRLDPARARKIAEECYGEVLAYCRRHAPAGYEPADLAQETFLRFVRAEGYRERGKPLAYLMRIARNVCVDAARKRRLPVVALDFDVPALEQEREDDELEEALAALPADLHEVVELRYGAGLAVNEVARVLGISRFAVRRRIKTALDLLRHELEEGGLHG